MKKIALFIIVIIILTPTIPVKAVDDIYWIEEYRLENYATGQLVLEWSSETDELLINAPVLAGDEYTLTFSLNVRQNVPLGVLELTISNRLEKESEAYFWEIENKLPVIDFNSAYETIQFDHINGTYLISIIGKIDPDLNKAGQILVLHNPRELTIVQLTGSDQLLDEIKITVIDSDIDDYNFLLSQKEAELEEFRTTNVDPAYVLLYENFVALAKDQAYVGLIDSAKDLLSTLEIEVTPVQTGPSFQEKYFIPAVGGLAVLAILGIVMFIRTNGTLGFVRMIVEDQIREMEALQSRASRIDRTLAQRLQEINDKLKDAERS